MSIFRTRRTYKPAAMDPERPVPREVLEELLEDAHWAPSHGLTQPWRFHVFRTPESRAELAGQLVALYDRAIPGPERDPAKRAKLAGGPRRAPVVVAVVARIEPDGKIPEWEELAAVSCAAQNFMLSAHQRGLGSFWSTPPVACSRELVEWLGHAGDDGDGDDEYRALGLLYLGWPLAGEAAPRSVRAPLAERVTWHGE